MPCEMPWVDVEDVHLFIPSPYWERIHSRLLKQNNETLESEGYCFIQFTSYAVAACFLQEYNGRQIPGTNMTFQLSWAPFWMYIDKRPDKEEMEDSNGKKKKDICLAPTVSKLVLSPPPRTYKDRSKDTIFIGAANPNFKEDEVLQIFSKFGRLACVLINTSRGCGLVQFKAMEAIQCVMQVVQKLVHNNKIGFIGWARSDEMQTTGAPMASRVDASCSAEPQEKTVDVDR